MAKKDFAGINTSRAFSTVETAISSRKRPAKASPEEARTRAEEMRTQGKAGCKAWRISMAFTPSNHDYIKIMSKISGMTMTEFVNAVIEKDRINNPMYEDAKKIRDQYTNIKTAIYASQLEEKPDKEE